MSNLVYDGFKFVTPVGVEPKLFDRTADCQRRVQGLFDDRMADWLCRRTKALIDAMRLLQSQSTSNPSSISQAAATAALNGDSSFLNEWRKAYTVAVTSW